MVNSLRILVVDDDPDSLDVLRRLLAREGHQVVAATSVASGLAAARAGQRIDVLISDIALPDGSGCDLMRAVKDLHEAPGIALSGYVDECDKQRAAEAGFCVHLNKPVRFADVIRAIADCMQSTSTAK